MNQVLLEKHLQLVIEANKTTNLTRITDVETARILHIEDSLAALQEMNAAPQGEYADIGSGAGYPGIPLALETQRKTTLVDSVKKKAILLEQFVEELGLSDTVSVYGGRVEELSIERPKSFSVITARAFSSLPSILELANPLLCRHGQVICYKAHVPKEEYDHAIELEKLLGMKLISDREIILSDDETYRRILVFEKEHTAKVKLPRRNGLAQKKPF
ncbi:MAG: 16S rRNA (guanine(527)-N(7))-methyltransferase RsmG [Eggerthellaceae bacterium]|nr:16S rRNA (guanine(527)-N(7))-methyltransferase RsmG [Eggerthellaceae bacterium]